MTEIFGNFVADMEKKVSLWQIFWVFAKIGAFTIGGGYAMIPIIQAEMSRRGWISDDDLPDIVALSQSAPGVMAVNISIFAGHKLRGIKGSIAATLGSITPSFLIILGIAMFFTAFKDNPYVERAFKGIRPVVISLIAVPMVDLACGRSVAGAGGISQCLPNLYYFVRDCAGVQYNVL